MTLRGTLGWYCVHIAQLITHPPISTLSFTLQLCYTPLGILQRVTKSDKFHISRHEGFPNFVTWNLLNLYARVSKSKERVAGIRPSLAKCYNCQAFGLLFFECRHSPHWHLQETTVSHEGLFDIWLTLIVRGTISITKHIFVDSLFTSVTWKLNKCIII